MHACMDVNYNASYRTNTPSFPYKLPWIFLVLMIFIIITSVLGNSLVLIATWRNKCLRKQGRCFLASLAVADILVGSFTTAARLYQSTGSRPLSAKFCTFYFWLVILANGVSVTTLAAVSIDRYCKIFYPLRYLARVTSRWHTSINTTIWLLCAVYGVLGVIPYSDGNEIYYSATDGCQNPAKTVKAVTAVFAFVFPFIVLTVTYFLIFLKAYRRRRSSEVHRHSSEESRFSKDLRNIVTLAVLVLAFFVFLCPYFIVRSFRGLDCSKYNDVCYAVVVVLPRFNSCCNPVIYACFDKEYRNAFKKLFGRH